MTSKKLCEIEENMKLKQKLLKLGFGCCAVANNQQVTQPSLIEGMFFTGFLETNISSIMQFDIPWLIPNDNKYFNKLNDEEIEVQPGVYEINLSGLIKNADLNHGGEVYLQTSEGTALKDLNFILLAGEDKKMYFSKNILFRFENPTILQVATNIIGDINDSNVVITEVSLFLKKIHE